MRQRMAYRWSRARQKCPVSLHRESCRSILGEATFNHLAPPGWQGAECRQSPDRPRASAFARPARHARLSTEGLPASPGTIAASGASPLDFVITSAPTRPARPARLSGPGAAHALGRRRPGSRAGLGRRRVEAPSVDSVPAARHRIELFIALPLNELSTQPARLKAALDRIGRHDATWPTTVRNRRPCRARPRSHRSGFRALPHGLGVHLHPGRDRGRTTASRASSRRSAAWKSRGSTSRSDC